MGSSWQFLKQEPRCGMLTLVSCAVQILERIGEEIDPEGVGLTFSDFENLATRMPDFVSTFRISL